MRAWVGSVALLLLMVLAPSASAHGPGVEVAVEAPAAAFEQQACIPFCQQPLWAQFTPGIPLVVESGATVTWTSVDTYHTATETGPLHSLCFNTLIWPDSPGSATFEARPDGLWAMDDASTEWSRCEQAVALGDGSYALAYNCLIHPTIQRSALVVVPEV